MPDPKAYDNKDDFISACIPKVIEEGTAKDQDQAVAICNSMWDERGKKEEKSMKKEIRILPTSEFRFVEEGGKPKFEGYAAVFNKWSEDLGGFREKIEVGAFRNAVKASDVRALFNHDQNYVLGRSTAGTLSIKEDDRGLFMSNTPPDTQWAKDLMISVNRGDINQMSFGFTVAEDEWNEDKEGRVTRTIHKVDKLFDVSVVAFPAYPDTSVALRSLEKIKEEKNKPKFTHVETKDIEPEITREKISELKEIAEKLNDFLADFENTSETEPMQGEEEKADDLKKEEKIVEQKGEGASEPMQAEEARGFWNNLRKK